MVYSIKRNQTPPAYIVTMKDEFSSPADVAAFYKKLNDNLNAELAPIPMILDTTAMSISFDALLRSTKNAMDNKEGSPYHNPKVEQLIIVSDHKLVEASVDGFEKFGIFENTRIAKTVDEALALLAN